MTHSGRAAKDVAYTRSAERHEDVAQELAHQFGLTVDDRLRLFFYGAYCTAVSDIADKGVPQEQRDQILAFMPDEPR